VLRYKQSVLRTLIISQDCRRHPTHTLRQCRSTGGAKRAWTGTEAALHVIAGTPTAAQKTSSSSPWSFRALHSTLLVTSSRRPSTAPHLGLQYYLQSADCLLSNPTSSAHHPRPRLPFVRPLFVKRITLPLSSTITPRHALCTPFHRPAFTALVRINLVTSTGPQRQQQERHTPTHRHTEREQSISYEIFHLATSNIKHQTSSKNLCDRSVRYSGHTLIFYSRDIWNTSTPATSAAHLEYPLVRSRSP
jgi:hypothetical protein